MATNHKHLQVGITNREVINAFRTLVADKVQISNQSGWSTRLVYYYILRYRAKLIREKVLRNRNLSHWNYQTIDCIPLQKTNASECPCAPAPGCEWLKIKYPIPKPLDRLKSVTSKDGQVTYSYVEWERMKNKITSRISAQRTYAYYTVKTRSEGTYLYLYNDVHKKHVTVTGIFENPLEVQYYPDCKGYVDPCQEPQNKEFILDPDLLPAVYDLAIGQINRAKQMGTDILEDDNDNITSTKINVK